MKKLKWLTKKWSDQIYSRAAIAAGNSHLPLQTLQNLAKRCKQRQTLRRKHVWNDLGGSVGNGLGGDVPMAVSGHAGCEAEAICEGCAHDLLQAGHDAGAALSEN